MSPSTVMQEKVFALARSSISCSRAGSIAASVKMKPSIVAISGAIMPDPLMMPTRLTVVPPIVALVVAPLAKVSVVPIASVASRQLASGASSAASMPASALSIGNGTPITPVEDTNTSDGWHPIAPATRAAIASTAARPRLPVKALELPAFTTRARARPSGNALRHHSTSGEGHLLLVVTPATAVPSSNAAKVRSQRSHVL